MQKSNKKERKLSNQEKNAINRKANKNEQSTCVCYVLPLNAFQLSAAAIDRTDITDSTSEYYSSSIELTIADKVFTHSKTD